MKQPEPYSTEALDTLFHWPNRLSILAALCEADDQIAFVVLRDKCGLTDGNLNRHLDMLKNAKVVRIQKKFVNLKPRTLISITPKGFNRFCRYMAAFKEAHARIQPVLEFKAKRDKLEAA